VVDFIKLGAELILEDDNGWKLYKVRALRPSITETGVLNHKF